MALRTGDIDYDTAVNPKDLAGIKSNSGLVLVQPDWLSNYHEMFFNMEKSGDFGIFAKSKQLRQAAAYGVDRDAMAKTLGMDIGKASQGFLRPGVLGFNASVPYYTFDLVKSKGLLKESGLTAPVDVHLMTHNRDLDMAESQIVKQMLDQVGFNVIIEIAERTANIAKRSIGHYEFLVWNPTASGDPDEEFTLPLGCGGAGNHSKYCNQDFDKCLAEGRTNYDQKQRQVIYERCQKILYEDLPSTHLWESSVLRAYAAKLKGFDGGWKNLNMRTAWLDR
jgi:ABC-type transport system substrate-binding protein